MKKKELLRLFIDVRHCAAGCCVGVLRDEGVTFPKMTFALMIWLANVVFFQSDASYDGTQVPFFVTRRV